MGQRFIEASQKFRKSMNNPQKKKAWRGGIGITIFALFVLSSVVVNQSVQALNQAAGNYGYYYGSYGYQDSLATSDENPSVPGGQSAAAGSGQVTVSWSAVTTTELSTNLDNFEEYVVYYSTTSANVLDTSNAGTNSLGATKWTSTSDSTLTTQGSASTTRSTIITGLTNGTAYYFAVYARDTNGNHSNAPSQSITSSPTGTSTTSSGGGGGSGSGTSAPPSTAPTYPAGPSAPASTGTSTAPVSTSVLSDADALAAQMGVTRDTAAEATYSTKVSDSVSEFGLTLTGTQATQATNFVVYGSSAATQKLGSGERLALVRDAFDSLQRFPNSPTTFFEQLATGLKPTERNLTREVAQLRQVLPMWEKLMGRRPNFKNAAEDLAWNTMMYRIRFIPRDLNKERVGITKFKSTFGRTPTSPLDWSAVRAWGYVLATR